MPSMLEQVRGKAEARGVAVEWLLGFGLGCFFDFVFIAANSLLHLHESDELLSCLRAVRRHLAPGARLVLDVFNPSLRLPAGPDGVWRNRGSLTFADPHRGRVLCGRGAARARR